MVNCKKVKLGDLWKESKVESNNPDSNKRIRVRLNVQGVEKRPDKDDQKGATKYFIRKAGQFIYGRQNFHKGAFGIIPEELDGFESSSDIPAFDVVPECNPEWLYYFFKQDDFYKKLEKHSKGTGSKRIHPEKIAHIEIPLPSREEQDKILEQLRLRENKGKSIQEINNSNESLLSSLRSSILQSAVQGKLVPQDPNDEPASELLKKVKAEKEKLIKYGKIKKDKPLAPISEDEIPYELPKGWQWVRLGDVGITQTGFTPNTSNSNYFGNYLPFIGPGDISDNKIIYSNKGLSKLGAEQGRVISKDSVLMVCIGGSIGKSIIVDRDISCNQQINTITNLGEISSKYTLIAITNPEFQQRLLTNSTGSATPIINKGKWESMLIPLPPLAEQKRIIKKVDKLVIYCDALEKQFKENQENTEKLMSAVLKEGFELK